MRSQIEQKIQDIDLKIGMLGAQRDVLRELLSEGKKEKRTYAKRTKKNHSSSSHNIADLPTPTIGKLTGDEILRVLDSYVSGTTHSKLLTAINAMRPRKKDKVTGLRLSGHLQRLHKAKKITKKKLKNTEGEGTGIGLLYRVAA